MKAREAAVAVLVVVLSFALGPASAHGAEPEAILVFDTSGSMRRLLLTAVDHARVTVGQTAAVITILAVDESGRDFGTFDLSTAEGAAQFDAALGAITASANDTNLDEVVVRIEHVAYRRGLPAGTPVYVYSDNISDPTPGHPGLDLAAYATAVADLGGGLKCFTMEVGRGFAAGAPEPLPAPAVVSGLELEVADGSAIKLSWEPSELAASYVVRRAVGDGEWQELANTTSPEYTDGDVDEGDACQYVVIAQSVDGVQSGPSHIARVQVPIPPPAQPVPVPVVLGIVALAVLIIGAALATRVLPGQEVAEDGAFGHVIPLGLSKLTLGQPGSGLAVAPRVSPLPGRAASVLGHAVVNGHVLEDGARIRLKEGDEVRLGSRVLHFRTSTGR